MATILWWQEHEQQTGPGRGCEHCIAHTPCVTVSPSLFASIGGFANSLGSLGKVHASGFSRSGAKVQIRSIRFQVFMWIQHRWSKEGVQGRGTSSKCARSWVIGTYLWAGMLPERIHEGLLGVSECRGVGCSDPQAVLKGSPVSPGSGSCREKCFAAHPRTPWLWMGCVPKEAISEHRWGYPSAAGSPHTLDAQQYIHAYRLLVQVMLVQGVWWWHSQLYVCVRVRWVSLSFCELGSSSSQPGYHMWILTVLPPNSQQKCEQIRLGSSWESNRTQGQQRMKGTKRMKQAFWSPCRSSPSWLHQNKSVVTGGKREVALNENNSGNSAEEEWGHRMMRKTMFYGGSVAVTAPTDPSQPSVGC